MDFDLKYLEKLARLLNDNGLSEITLENEQKLVSLKKEISQSFVSTYNVDKLMSIENKQTPVQKEEKPKDVSHSGQPIKSPMVGTFYSSPSPEDAPFVNVGDTISKGQVICIIEAMKLMNEIEAEFSGKITEICVKNGDSIEFDQVLMYIES